MENHVFWLVENTAFWLDGHQVVCLDVFNAIRLEQNRFNQSAKRNWAENIWILGERSPTKIKVKKYDGLVIYVHLRCF